MESITASCRCCQILLTIPVLMQKASKSDHLPLWDCCETVSPLATLPLFPFIHCFMLKMTSFKFLVWKENETQFMVHQRAHPPPPTPTLTPTPTPVPAWAAHQDRGRLGPPESFVVVLEVKCLFHFHWNERGCSTPQFAKSHSYCSL